MSLTPYRSSFSLQSEGSESRTSSNLCSFCLTLAKELSTCPSPWQNLDFGGYRNQQSSTTGFDLLGTTTTCKLCKLIVSSSVNDGFTFYPTLESCLASMQRDWHISTAGLIDVFLGPYQGRSSYCGMNISTRRFHEWHHASLGLSVMAEEGSSPEKQSSSVYTCAY